MKPPPACICGSQLNRPAYHEMPETSSSLRALCAAMVSPCSPIRHRHIHAADRRFARCNQCGFSRQEAGFVMGGNRFAGKQQPPPGSALTNGDRLRPVCDCQVQCVVAVNASRVALSGIRNSRQTHQPRLPAVTAENSCAPEPLPTAAFFWITFIGQLIRQFVRLFSYWLRR